MTSNKYLTWTIFLAMVSATVSQDAPDCVPSDCKLPNCRCSSSDLPGGFGPSNTPQLVFLSFDAAVSLDNFAFYNEALFNRKNPNGQSITVTFFVNHDYTNYTMIHDVWRHGHEIGLHSISGNFSQAYWQNLDAAGWRKELIDQRTQLNTFARVPSNEIIGVRAPQLQVGGDAMYNVLLSASIKYDSSRPTQAFRTRGLWPYTNDYKSIQDCQVGKCPTGRHPGFWTVPIINLQSTDGTPCSLADQCTPVPKTSNETFNLLKANFENHYHGHRSPFGIFARHGWVNGTGDDGDDVIWQRRLGYVRFLDYLSSLNDVYIVSIARGLEWVKNPTPLANVASFPAFQVAVKNSVCQRNFACFYDRGQTPFKPPFAQERWFHSCIPCPAYYPWVGNPLGRQPYQ